MSNSVLVVEDHDELRMLIEHRLTQGGYDVHCAATIQEAIARLNAMPNPCVVLWDPTTLSSSGALVTLAARLGIHIATIPVGITSAGQTADGSPIIVKRLTSLEAILSILRAHCSSIEEQPLSA